MRIQQIEDDALQPGGCYYSFSFLFYFLLGCHIMLCLMIGIIVGCNVICILQAFSFWYDGENCFGFFKRFSFSQLTANDQLEFLLFGIHQAYMYVLCVLQPYVEFYCSCILLSSILLWLAVSGMVPYVMM